MRTLSQKRAEFALHEVVSIPSDKKEKFKHFASGAPPMILQNGFGQALAFWLSKGEYKHEKMFAIVKNWLCANKFADGDSNTEFIRNISQMDHRKYLEAQKETLALLEWVKRYANADL